MKPCRRVGVEVTKKCNLRCKTCFYRHKSDFNADYDRPIDEVLAHVDSGKAGGCDHVVQVGWGEPFLYKHQELLLMECHKRGMSTSIISNGCVGTRKLSDAFEIGLNHLHMSVHGLGDVLDRVFDVPGAHEKQEDTKDWLKENKKPWRSNTTLQLENYKQLPEIVQDCIDHGVFHFVFLGFLPHYEWGNRLQEVAVHPAELRPYIEEGIRICERAEVYTTVRYHPMCHLKPEYWKYVVNARYVVYDPWEWCYNVWPNADPEQMWVNALGVGGCVSIKTAPCANCALNMHCGGWNATYAGGFGGAGLRAIEKKDIPPESIETRGYYHDQNPANHLKGYV